MKTWPAIFILFIFWIAIQMAGHGQNRIDSLEIALQFEDEPARKVDIIFSLVEEFKTSNQDRALTYAQQALEISLTEGYLPGELKSYNFLGEIYINKTDLKAAMDYTVKAKSLADQIEDKVELGQALYNMGRIYTDLGNYEKSSELYYECLKLSEQINDRALEARALNSIGIIHHNQNNYDKALEYYFKALNIAREISYTSGISKGLNNIAAIYGINGEYDKVVRYLREAIALNLEQGDQRILGVNYLNFGYYFQELEQYDSALYFFNKSLKIYKELEIISSILSSKIFLAEYYMTVGELEKSKHFAQESLEEGKANGLKRFVYETAALLSNIYALQQDSIRAYRYQILELQMKDSLNIEESQTEISKLELQYELEKAEQNKRIEQQKKDVVIFIILISLVFIIVVIVLLMGRMRIKARSVKLEKEKLEMNLELRNNELTANVMSIMKKNEILTQIAKKLKGIQNEAVKDETKVAIRKIARTLNKAVEDEPWQEFELRFKQVHSEFFNKLIDSYPNLSPQDQRLCAFLRLNMTTKEISEITGQRTSTIEMARTRLRKKLGITNTHTNLITFLGQI